MKRLQNLKSNKGSVLFIVLAIMTLLVALAAATFFTVHSAGRSINTEYMNEQAYQAGSSVNELVYESISLGTGDNSLREKILELAIGTKLDNVATETKLDAINGYSIAGVTITRVTREQFLLTCSVEKDGEIQTVEMTKDLGDIVKLCKVKVELTVKSTTEEGVEETEDVTYFLPTAYYENELVSLEESVKSHCDDKTIQSYSIQLNDATNAPYNGLTCNQYSFNMPDGDVIAEVEVSLSTTSLVPDPETSYHKLTYTQLTGANEGEYYVRIGHIYASPFTSGAFVQEGALVYVNYNNSGYEIDTIKYIYGETTVTLGVGETSFNMPAADTRIEVTVKKSAVTLNYTDIKFFDGSTPINRGDYILVNGLHPTDIDCVIEVAPSSTLLIIPLTDAGDTYIIKDSSPAANITHTITDDTIISATIYRKSKLTLKDTDHGSYIATIGGTPFASGNKAVEGDEVTLTITPEAGYKAVSVTVGTTTANIVDEGTPTASFKFNMPSTDTEVVVTCEPLEYTVTERWDDSEDIDFDNRSTGYGLVTSAVRNDATDYTGTFEKNYACGSTVTFTIFSKPPYAIRDNWNTTFNKMHIVVDSAGNAVPLTPDYSEYNSDDGWKTTYEFVMPASNVTINYSFQIAEHQIFFFNQSDAKEVRTYDNIVSLILGTLFDLGPKQDYSTYPGENESNNKIIINTPRVNFGDDVTISWSSDKQRLLKYELTYARTNTAATDLKSALKDGRNNWDIPATDTTFTMPNNSVILVGKFCELSSVVFNEAGNNGVADFRNLNSADVKITVTDSKNAIVEEVDTTNGTKDYSLNIAKNDKLSIVLIPKTGYKKITNLTYTEPSYLTPVADIITSDTGILTGNYLHLSDGGLTLNISAEKYAYTLNPFEYSDGTTVGKNRIEFIDTDGDGKIEIGNTIRVNVTPDDDYHFDPAALALTDVTGLIKYNSEGELWEVGDTFAYAEFTLTAAVIEAYASAYDDTTLDIECSLPQNVFKHLYTLTVLGTSTAPRNVKYSINGASTQSYDSANPPKYLPNDAISLSSDFTHGYRFRNDSISGTILGTGSTSLTMPERDMTVFVEYKANFVLDMPMSSERHSSTVLVRCTTSAPPIDRELSYGSDMSAKTMDEWFWTTENIALTVSPDPGYTATVTITYGSGKTSESYTGIDSPELYNLVAGDSPRVSIQFVKTPKYIVTIKTDPLATMTFKSLNESNEEVSSFAAGKNVYIKISRVFALSYGIKNFTILSASDNMPTEISMTVMDATKDTKGTYNNFLYAVFEMPAYDVIVVPTVGLKQSSAAPPHDPSDPDVVDDDTYSEPETFVETFQNTAGDVYVDHNNEIIQLPEDAETILQSQYVLAPLKLTSAVIEGSRNRAALIYPIVSNSIYSNGDLLMTNARFEPISGGDPFEINVMGNFMLSMNSGTANVATNGGTIRVLDDFTYINGDGKTIGNETDTTDLFVLGNATFGAAGSTFSGITHYGDIKVAKNLNYNCAPKIYGDVWVGGDFNLNHDNGTTINGNVYINGNMTTKGDLTVNGKLIVKGKLTVGRSFTTDGSAELGSLDIGCTKFSLQNSKGNGNLLIEGDLSYLSGCLNWGAANVAGSLYVGGNITSSGISDSISASNGYRLVGNNSAGISFGSSVPNVSISAPSYASTLTYDPTGEIGTVYTPASGKIYVDQFFTLPEANKPNYEAHINGYNGVITAETNYPELYPADGVQASTRDIIYYRCAPHSTQTLWNPIRLVPDIPLTLNNHEYRNPTPAHLLTTFTTSGKLTCNTDCKEANTVVFDTTNGTPNNPLDDEDLYIELLPNISSATDGPLDTFAWNKQNVPTNVFIKGAGSVIFVLNTSNNYRANNADFVGHAGWLTEAGKNFTDIGWFGTNALFGNGNFSQNKNMIETLSSVYAEKCKEYAVGSENYNKFYDASKLETSKNTYLFYNENASVSEGGKLKTLFEKYGINSEIEDSRFMHNNIFLVSSNTNGSISFTATGSNPPRFMGYIYAPKMTFVSKATDTSLVLIGGLVAYDFHLTATDKISDEELMTETGDNAVRYLYTTPFDQYRLNADGKLIGTSLMSMLVDRSVAAAKAK